MPHVIALDATEEVERGAAQIARRRLRVPLWQQGRNWLIVDRYRHGTGDYVLPRALQARNRVQVRFQRCRITVGGNGDDIESQALGQRVVDLVAQILAENENQADGEDADDEGQHGRRRARLLPPDVAQRHLRVGFPGARQDDNHETEQRDDQQQRAKGRQSQENQHGNRHRRQHQRQVAGAETLRHGQHADDEDHQPEEDAQDAQEDERAIDRADAQRHIAQDDDRHRAEQDREQQQQTNGQRDTARAAFGQFANHVERANVGCLHNRHQAKDERGEEANHDTAHDGERVKHKGDVQLEKLLHQIAHYITDADSRARADSAADQAQQAGLQPEEQVEIGAAIARRLEHGNLRPAPRKQHLHGIDDTDAADQQGQQSRDFQKLLDVVYLLLVVLQRVRRRLRARHREVILNGLHRLIGMRLIDGGNIYRVIENGQFRIGRIIVAAGNEHGAAGLRQRPIILDNGGDFDRNAHASIVLSRDMHVKAIAELFVILIDKGLVDDEMTVDEQAGNGTALRVDERWRRHHREG